MVMFSLGRACVFPPGSVVSFHTKTTRTQSSVTMSMLNIVNEIPHTESAGRTEAVFRRMLKQAPPFPKCEFKFTGLGYSA